MLTQAARYERNEARMTGSGVAATRAVQAASQAYSYANEARMSSNSSVSGYGGYSGYTGYTGYHNSSYQTGKAPSPDAPRVEDVTGEDVYYCNGNRVENNIEEYFSHSNIYGTIVGGLSVNFSALFKHISNSIKISPRPANIGAGTYAKQIAKELEELSKISAGFSKILNVLSYGAVVIDVGIGVYDNIQKSNSVQHIVADAAVDAAVTGSSIWAAAAIGSLIGGPVGTVVALAGSALIYVGTDMIEINGKSARDWVKVGAEWAVDNISDKWNEVKSLIVS